MTDPIPRSILVATDLTSACDAAVVTAGRLAAASGAALHAIHVHDFSARIPGARRSDDFSGRMVRAERALHAQFRRLLPGRIVNSATVPIHHVPHAVADRALEVGADLVVLGPRRRGLLDAFRRTTAEKVLRRAGVPCLVVPRPLELPLRRVVVGVHPSRAARDAVRVGVGWSGWLGARAGEARSEVQLVHVSGARYGPAWTEFVRPLLEDARTECADGVHVRAEVARGADRAARLAELTSVRSAGLLVVGARCRTGWVRALAAVPGAVLRRADLPVLLVPPSTRGSRPRPLRGARRGADGLRPAGVAT